LNCASERWELKVIRHLRSAANQSFERTRSAAASGFAGQQLWRAAQLQIRYTSG
jgi:hypothetical protein